MWFIRKILLRLSLRISTPMYGFLFFYSICILSNNVAKISEKNEREAGRIGERKGKREERMEREIEEGRIWFKKKKRQKAIRISKRKQNFHTHSIAKLVTRLNSWSLRLRSPLLITLLWHHRLSGHEFGWTLGVGDGQGGLACCSSGGCKESDTTERLNWTGRFKIRSPVRLREWAYSCWGEGWGEGLVREFGWTGNT